MKKFRKALLITAASLAVTSGLAGCNKKNKQQNNEPDQQEQQQQTVAVSSVSLDKETLALHIGETYDLVTTVLPENATDKSVTYTSTIATVASVSESGKITALAEGTTVVVAQSAQDPSKFAQVIVTVTKLHIAVANLTVDHESFDLLVGGTADIVATITPSDATDKSISFNSSRTDVATVDQNGHIVAVAPGTAYIFVVPNDNPGKQKMVVVNVSLAHIAVTSVEMDTTPIQIALLGTTQLSANVLPANATDKALQYLSGNQSVVTVSETGLVTGVGYGTTTVTVSSHDDPSKFKSVSITVADAVISVTGVELNQESFSIEENASPVQLTATVLPSDATNKSLIWESSDPSVAYVSQTGLVTPMKASATPVTITVTTADGGHTDTCTVTVTKTDLQSLSLNRESILFEFSDDPANDPDTTVQLVATLNPANATYQDIEWHSSDTQVATVSSTGLVTRGTKVGHASITAVHLNSNKTKSCEVEVKNMDVEEITLNINPAAISFLTNATGSDAQFDLDATLTPANVPDKGIVWTSSNPAVATVDENGVVRKNTTEKGSAIITAASHSNPGIFALCTVSVTEPNEFEFMGSNPKKSYESYLSYRGERVNKLEEFVQKDKVFKVGDDNPVNFLPVLKIFKGVNQVHQSNWAFPFDITVTHKTGGTPATANEVEIISSRTVDLQFKEDAIGQIFNISVVPTGIDPDDIEDATEVYEVEVIDGMNINDGFDLLYLDERDDNFQFGTRHEGGGDVNHYPYYGAFKREHGIDESKRPSAIILQDDIQLKRRHVPANLIYDEQFAIDKGWSNADKEKYVGSLKDNVSFYRKDSDTNMTIEGNYFTLDWTDIPYVRRPSGQDETNERKVNSHSSLLRIFGGGVDLQNINLIGNSHAASNEDQTIARGGLMGFKYTGDCDHLDVTNIISHALYISFMSEGGINDEGAMNASGTFTDMKCYDNFNSFLYNYAGHMEINNSHFEGCGGPVVIQDHTGIEPTSSSSNYDTDTLSSQWDSVDTEHGQFVVHGLKPLTEFNNCTIQNYVIGTEVWFQMFGATSVVSIIKVLSDKVGAKDGAANPLTFLFDENHAGTTYADSAAAAKDCMMNFVVLNKSNKAEGMTAFPVDGEVIFRDEHGDVVDDFNYMNPNSMTAATSEEQTRFQAEVTNYATFRGVQKGGAPVYETSGGTAAFFAAGMDEASIAAGGVFSMASVAAAAVASDPTLLQNPAAGLFNSNGHMALYFNGMALILGTGHVGQ